MVSLGQGEPIIHGLTELARKMEWGLAQIQGLAGVQGVELGCFNLAEKNFRRQTFSAYYELVSATGNISLLPDGSPYVHIHAALAGEDFHLIGGHLFEAKIAVVGEFFVHPEPETLPRQFVPRLNVAAWDIERCRIT